MRQLKQVKPERTLKTNPCHPNYKVKEKLFCNVKLEVALNDRQRYLITRFYSDFFEWSKSEGIQEVGRIVRRGRGYEDFDNALAIITLALEAESWSQREELVAV